MPESSLMRNICGNDFAVAIYDSLNFRSYLSHSLRYGLHAFTRYAG